ncbi:hypothetical protein HK098_001067 [Nowakowskiella sp. JEL0407]|nr:hypothetical protein HK098_001067 [Nowakowskiella sp. JEL0407]
MTRTPRSAYLTSKRSGRDEENGNYRKRFQPEQVNFVPLIKKLRNASDEAIVNSNTDDKKDDQDMFPPILAAAEGPKNSVGETSPRVIIPFMPTSPVKNTHHFKFNSLPDKEATFNTFNVKLRKTGFARSPGGTMIPKPKLSNVKQHIANFDGIAKESGDN